MSLKSLKKKDIGKKIHQELGFSKNFSESFVNNFFNILVENFKKNECVKIPSFGTFKMKLKKERIGRNPKTKDIAKISARKVVTFKASPFLKNKLNKNND